MEQCGFMWDCITGKSVVLSREVCDYVKLCGFMWNSVDLSGAAWLCLECCGLVGKSVTV